MQQVTTHTKTKQNSSRAKTVKVIYILALFYLYIASHVLIKNTPAVVEIQFYLPGIWLSDFAQKTSQEEKVFQREKLHPKKE